MERNFYRRYVYLSVLLLGQYPYHKTPSTKLEINDLISTPLVYLLLRSSLPLWERHINCQNVKNVNSRKCPVSHAFF